MGKALSQAKQRAARSLGAVKKCPLTVGQVLPYGQAQKMAGPGLQRDHMASGAALTEALRRYMHQRRLGRPKRDQINRLRRNALTIAIPAWFHRLGRTFGGKNNQAQINADASDLEKATQSDIRSYRSVLRDIDNGTTPISAAQRKDLSKIRFAIKQMRRMQISKAAQRKRFKQIAENKPLTPFK